MKRCRVRKTSSGRVCLAERIGRYIDAMPPAVSGQFGHRQTFFVARALVHGFGLSVAEALPYLRQYNQRCEPPWKEAELKYKLASAEDWQPRNGSKPRGYLK
jgi:hypothetical protein